MPCARCGQCTFSASFWATPASAWPVIRRLVLLALGINLRYSKHPGLF